MVCCKGSSVGVAVPTVVALCLPSSVRAQHVTTWTTRPVSHLQLSRWFFFASPAQVNGHFGFWSILGVLSGIGALIIGITYLICRFKKPTNQVADRDRNMMDDNFVHTNVRTVLYPDHHLERQYLQPAPVVRLESSRPLSYGAAEQRSCHTATEATPVAIGASTSTPIPLTITSSTAFNNRPRLNKLAIGRWSALKKKPGCENDLPGGFFDKNSVRKEQFKLNFVSAGKTHTAVKLAPKSNFLTMKPKCTVITL